MANGNFIINVVDVPVYINYTTDPKEEQYVNYDFVFLGENKVVYNKKESSVELREFILEGVVRQRVEEQTGRQFKVIAISVS